MNIVPGQYHEELDWHGESEVNPKAVTKQRTTERDIGGSRCGLVYAW